MSAFGNFSNTLPDSIRTIGDAGQAGGQIKAVKQVAFARNAITDTNGQESFALSSGCVGQGAKFTTTTDTSGIATSISIVQGGNGYAVGDVITIYKPADNNTHGLALEVTEVTTGKSSAGFKSVQVTSKAPIMRSRTQSGKLITRSASYHSFSLNISYNKLLKEEFMPLYTFLLEKQGSLKPFFVQLPQYGQGRSLGLNAAILAGDTTLTVDTYLNTNLSVTRELPSPGDLFTFEDSSDSNHTKAYMVTRVETNEFYSGTQPTEDTAIIHFTPPISKGVSSGSIVNFANPKIKVIMKSDATPYTLDQDNLYTFKLQVEEAVQ